MPPGAAENLSAVLHAKGDLRVCAVAAPPPPAAHEVRVSMRSVGICGSDVHFWTAGRIGDFVVRAPLVLGHEGSGIVEAVGSAVTGLTVGDRVALEPGVPCATCEPCRGGRYNLCGAVRFAATPPVHGCLARVVNHPAAFCYKLPPSVSLDHAALLEPLSVALHACRRGNVALGNAVFITGAGPIGLMCVLAARAAGAARVVVADVDRKRLQVAKRAGASEIVVVGESEAEGERDRVDADVCIEASGAGKAVGMCIRQAKSGGVVVVVGMGESMVNVPLLEAACREVDIKGVFRYCNTYQRALDLVATGVIDASFMVTHRFPLDKAVDAFETARDSKVSEAIKVIIDCGSE